uniref:Late endosomal/lysosomal adaptor and MAPK and MTOR activator 5 n=1 Tax=Anisakis simplex TaxID=6269 RepID=A0A0M3K4Z7_ANISI
LLGIVERRRNQLKASKTQRKFCTCSPDCSYAAIVEDKRRAFIYWQPTALDTDLRNRTSGQRVKAVAKQNLVSLSMIDSDGFKRDVLENIVGVFADTKALFILTTKHLFVIVLK